MQSQRKRSASSLFSSPSWTVKGGLGSEGKYRAMARFHASHSDVDGSSYTEGLGLMKMKWGVSSFEDIAMAGPCVMRDALMEKIRWEFFVEGWLLACFRIHSTRRPHGTSTNTRLISSLSPPLSGSRSSAALPAHLTPTPCTRLTPGMQQQPHFVLVEQH